MRCHSLTNPTVDNELTAIREFAMLLKTGISSLDRIKVYFCGNPGVGKTTLAQSLLRSIDETSPDSGFERKDPIKSRTRGISIMRVRLPNGTLYSFWDFAGQADYHVHHDLFIYPEAALFIVIVDARLLLGEQERDALYWLQYIVTQCPPWSKPRVLLLASHCDEAINSGNVSANDIESNCCQLMDRISSVFRGTAAFVLPHIVQINCKDFSSTSFLTVSEQLESLRLRFLAENPTPTPLICKQMVDVTESMRAQGIHFLTWSKYCEVMSRLTDNTAILSSATRYLHCIGDIYYDENRKIGGLVIIDLAWLCGTVLGWLFCPVEMLSAHEQLDMIRFRRAAECGPIKKRLIPIVNSFKGSAVDTLDVLELFELCYGFQHDDEIWYVFPSLLRTKSQLSGWCKNGTFDAHLGLKLTSESPTAMIPPGFFHRIQVRVRQDIGPKFDQPSKSTKSAIWKNGVVCIYDNAVALIELCDDGRGLFIHARSSRECSRDVRVLMQKIVSIIYHVSESSPGLILTVHAVSSLDLCEYLPTPRTVPLKSLVMARSIGLQCINFGADQLENIKNVLCLHESDGLP